MKPFYEAGTFCTGPACEVCHKCGQNPCSCKKCHKEGCAYPEPFLDIDKVPNTEAVYRINDNGKTAKWDMGPGVKAAQTDTSLVADIINRLLKFSAERHTDTITAQELGEILHLTDLGDVSTKGAENGAMMVYKKNDTCPTGCYGTSNVWQAWNALAEQAESVSYGYGFNANGEPASLQQPSNPDQYYNLGWNGNRQLSYAQPAFETAVVTDTEGFAWQMYIHPRTMQPYYVKVKVS